MKLSPVGQVFSLPKPLATPGPGRLQVRPTGCKGFVRPPVGQVCNLPNPLATLFKVVAILFVGLLAAAPAVAADPGIEWVTVGDPGNPPDAATGRGAVAGPFQISKHEVTVGQYAAFLNAVAKNDPHGLWTGGLPITRTGDPGAFAYAAAAGHEREPVVRVTFLDCMRFANWLHHLQAAAAPADPAQLTETGAYEIAAGGGLVGPFARSPGVDPQPRRVVQGRLPPAPRRRRPGGALLAVSHQERCPAHGRPGGRCFAQRGQLHARRSRRPRGHARR